MRLNKTLFGKLIILVVIGALIQNHNLISIILQTINIFDIDLSITIHDSMILILYTICLLANCKTHKNIGLPNMFLAKIFVSTSRTSISLLISKIGEQIQISKKPEDKISKKVADDLRESK